MSLLTPWFLAGALLIAGPIIFHLIRRATKDRVPFSATRFLRESPPKLQKKSKIQNPWLLALRCLAVALLAFAFARPFFRSDSPIDIKPTPPAAIVIALDTSASMQREGAWDRAVEQAQSYIDQLEPIDRLSIVSVAANARLLVSFDQWNKWPAQERAALATGLLEETQPGWGSSRLDDAIELAVAELEQVDEETETVSSKKVVLISDMQATSRIAGIAGREWPEGCQLELKTIEGTHLGNTGIRWLGWTGDDKRRSLRIGVQSSGRPNESDLTLTLFDPKSDTPLGSPVSLFSNPGDNHMILLDVPENVEGPFEVRLAGDPEEFDNRLFVAENEPRPMRLDYYGDINHSDDPNHAAYYMKRAVAGWVDPVIDFGSHIDEPESATDLPPFLYIDSALTRETIESVREAVESGSHALVLFHDPDLLPTVSALAGGEGWTTGVVGQADSRLSAIDFQHYAFALFADPRFSDFSRIRFWHTHTLEMPSREGFAVVAEFDDGSPAILEKQVGNGMITFWVANWAPQHSQWALSTKFVPWLKRIVERAAGGSSQTSIARIDALGGAFESSSSQWQTMGEEGFSSDLPVNPGLYRLKQGPVERWVALQMPPEESQWDPMPIENWERLGAPLDSAAAAANSGPLDENERRTKNAVELEGQQQIWKWMVIAVAILLFLESLIARGLQNREGGAAA